MRLSIITINYNNCPGLQKTIDSVVSQTFRHFEWIVIDGGSTDGSRSLIEQYREYFSYWVSESDRGIYNAMNKAIVRATGDYCLFLNSGDALYNENTLADVFQEDLTEDVVYGFFYKVTKEGSIILEDNSSSVTLGTFLYGTINHSGCSFIKRSLFDKYGLYDESLKIVSDWKFFLIAIGLGQATIKHIRIPISFFDMSGIGSVNIDLCRYEREQVIHSVIPQRILQDYELMQKERELFIKREQLIRSSLSYRLGHFVLSPIKFLRKLLK